MRSTAVLVDQKKVVAIAVHHVSGRRRWLKLNEWGARDNTFNQPEAEARW
jgi:hypothetical protein